jgi:hypothetical protein
MVPRMQPNPETAQAARGPAIALIVRHAELLSEAVQTALQFRAAAQAVSLYLLEPAATALGAEDERSLAALKAMAADCRCNHRPTVARLDLTYSDVADIARGLDAAGWVLTF